MTWLGFGARAWLAAFAALALPFVIHLLSRGRQQRRPIGSTRWLVAAPTERARRLRLSRWLLLMLRALLLAVVVLALADPMIKPVGEANPDNWLLVAPEVMRQRERLEADNQAPYAALDEALTVGHELRWLAPGLPGGGGQPPAGAAADELWSFLAEADRLAPPGVSFVVVAAPKVETLRGVRPQLAHTVEWHEVLDTAANRWFERVTAAPSGELRVLVGMSDVESTRYDSLELAGDESADAGISAADDRLALVVGGGVAIDDAVSRPAAPARLQAVIYFDTDRAEDAQYIEAGLAAAAAAGVRSADLRRQLLADEAPVIGAESVAFWLSARPVPTSLLDAIAAGSVLVSDGLDRYESCGASLVLSGAPRPLTVDRCAEVDDGSTSAVAVWMSPSGRELLWAEGLRDGVWLRFASRWNPGWTDLVLSPAFPTWLLSLAESSGQGVTTSTVAGSDRRSAAAQARPTQASIGEGETARRETSLASLFWLVALGLAIAERAAALGRAG